MRLAEGLASKPLRLHCSHLQCCASTCTAQDRVSSALQMAEPGGVCRVLKRPISPLVVLCCAVPCLTRHVWHPLAAILA